MPQVLPRRPLGHSGLSAPVLSLGSWKTFERIPRPQAVATMAAAREAGIDFLDDARYDDPTGEAPLASGYSEVLFGELVRAAGWPRDEVLVANKLWWEFWPSESAAQELDGSLGRMGLDQVDLIYACPPPAGHAVEDVVEEVNGLIAAGKARAWGVAMWTADQLRRAGEAAARQGTAPPCAVQDAYSLARRSPVEDADLRATLAVCGASVVASASLAGGALTGKYATPGAAGRLGDDVTSPEVAAAVRAGARLAEIASEFGVAPAALALAAVLANPDVATALFGATTPEQVWQNAASVEVLERHPDAVEAVRRLEL